MAEVRAAVSALDLGAGHAVAGVALARDLPLRVRRVNAGPARAGFELGPAVELGLAAACAAIYARLLAVPLRARERRLGAFPASHGELLGAEFAPP